MASTRNNNTSINYNLEQRQYKHFENYTLYSHSQYGSAYSTRLPGNGANPGQINASHFSHNPIEIESFLFGINSTNLVNPEGPLVPQLKNLDNQDFFERRRTIIPQPLVVEKHQRPFPCP